MSEKVYTIEEIKKILAELLKDKPVYQVILFGSYAKKQANKKSDIDLIIDTKGTLRGLSFLEIIDDMEDAFDKNVDGFEEYELIKGSKIDDEINKTGVVVYEK